MRRGIAFVLAFSLLVLLCACGSDGNITDEQITVQQENDLDYGTAESGTEGISDNYEITEITEENGNNDSQEEFIENEDLKVVTSFVYDNDTYVVVENVGEEPILNFSIAYLNFDKNGFVTTTDSDGYESGKADAVNLMPGEKYIGGWYGATGNYAKAAIKSVDYSDGTQWTVQAVNLWVDEVSGDFSVEDYKTEIENLAEIGTMAESNDYATLSNVYMYHGNQFSTNSDLYFTVTNTGDRGITQFNIFVLEFDENGFPVSVNPYDTYCTNGHMTGGKINLASGQSKEYSDDLFISGETANVKAAIAYMEFQDGSEWNNPYIYEWIVANNKSY